MSRFLPGEQVEHAFNAKRLNNWEVAKEDETVKLTTTTGTRFGTLGPRAGKTDFIVDEKGHLLPGMPKISNSFNHPATSPVYMKSVPRWPQENPVINHTPNATMGYKGIITDYLPSSTVTLKAVEVKTCKETNYNFK